VCDPFTPYVSQVGKISSACITKIMSECRHQIIKSNQHHNKQINPKAHSLTQSGVQGGLPMPPHPQGHKPAHSIN
jgi:hypothetical protein